MSLNLNIVSQSESFGQLIEKLNTNFQIIANSNGGPEGKQGSPGAAGLPGVRGPVGNQGATGPRGSKWFLAASILEFPNEALTGDFSILPNGDFYENTVDGWVKLGTFNYSSGLTIDMEDVAYKSNYSNALTNLKTLINSKTNQTLLLTNMDKPDPSLGVQIPVNDSPGDSYPLIQGNDTTLKELYDYKLKIYNSGNEEDDNTQIYGRNIHLGNSFSMITKDGWLLSSGFTIGIDLLASDINSNPEGTEIFRLTGQTSGNVGHRHRVQIDNSDLWVSSFRANKDGKVSIGFSDTYEGFQKLDVSGGILIGDTSIGKPGSIRFNNSKFQGHNGDSWVDLSLSATDVITLIKNTQTTFNDKIIDTGTTGGVVLGNYSAGTAKAGSTRYNSTTGDFEGYNGSVWLTLNNKVLLGNVPGNGGGQGFVDSAGNPVSAKIAVNSNDDGNAGAAIYEGLILVSSDKSIEINQSVLNSKYAVLDLTSNGAFQTTDENGNPVAVNGFDIISNDLEITKSNSNGNQIFNLNLKNSQVFKEAVASGFDLRSSDGSMKLEPPSSNKSYWDITASKSLGALSDTDISSKFKASIARYVNTSNNVISSPSTIGSEKIFALEFPTKDFDENCNVTSTEPFIMKVSKTQSGFYRISARARFVLDNGTPTGARLVVIKDSSIVSVLESVTSNDSFDITHGTTKEYELAGSDIVDFACVTGDCANEFKVAIAVPTANSVTTLTLKDSSISVNKITTVTQDSIDEYLANSNVAFKEITLYDNANAQTGNLVSLVNAGKIKLALPTYLTYTVIDNTYLKIDANIASIKSNIDPDNLILKKAFTNFIVEDAFNYSANTSQIIKFKSGDNVNLSLTNNEITISATIENFEVYSSSNIVSNSSTKFNFDTNFSVGTANGLVNIGLNTDNVASKVLMIHTFTDYYENLSSISAGASENISGGILNYNNYSSSNVAAIKYVSSDEEILDSTLGEVTDEDLVTSFVFVPTETAKYSISCIVGADVVAIKNSLNATAKYKSFENGHLALGLFKLGGSGYTIKSGSDNSQAELIKILGSSEVDIRLFKTWSKNNTNYYAVDKKAINRITGTSILELEEDAKYAFGVMSGIARTDISALVQNGTVLNVHPISIGNDLKIVLFDADISISKIG